MKAGVTAGLVACAIAAASGCSYVQDSEDRDVRDLRKRTSAQILSEAEAMMAEAIGGSERMTALDVRLSRVFDWSTGGDKVEEHRRACKVNSTTQTNSVSNRSEIKFTRPAMPRPELDALLAVVRDNLDRQGYTVHENYRDWKWAPDGRRDRPYELAARKGTKESNDLRLFADTWIETAGPEAGKSQVSFTVVPACYQYDY